MNTVTAQTAGRRQDIDRQTLRIFWQASMRRRRLMVLTIFQTLGALMLNIVAPLFIGKIIGSFFVPGANHTHYIPYFVGAAAVGVLCNRIGFPSLMSLQAYSQTYLQARCLDALLKRGASFHANNVSGKLIADTTDFCNAYGTLLLTGVGNVAVFAVTFLVGSAVIFTESWLLGVIVAGMAVFAFGSSYFESRRRHDLRQRRLAANKAVTSHLADTIANVQTVKSFAREDHELKTNHHLGSILRDLRLTDWVANGYQNNNRIAVLLGFQLAFIIGLLYLVPHNPALLGIGVFGFTFAINISNRMIDLTIQLVNVEEALLQASPMTEILLQEAEINDKPGAKDLQVSHGTLNLQNVTFHYGDTSQTDQVFSDLSLDIKPGEKIGLVGPSGGGKSTLVRLLLRFEDIDSGSISIDGQNIAEITQSSLRQAIAYVPQEPLLFHRTVSENIAYGKPDATAAEIKQAAHQAYADDFISQLPEGYGTIVGERGVKLSGGQRQRVAIARAILKDAPILLLDEATSALDSDSEAHIQDALNELMSDRTALVIAHRLSTIQHMDRIVVLEDGRISEQGSHAALLKHEGTYAKLWARQSGGFIED